MLDYDLMFHTGLVSNGERLWYYAEMLGCVIEVDPTTGQMDCLFSIPHFCNKNESEPQYRVMRYQDGNLYLLPYATNNMYIYEVKSKIITEVKLANNKCYCTGMIFRDGLVYIYGTSPCIYIYDLYRKNVSSVTIDPKALGMKHVPEKWFWIKPFIYKENICLLLNSNSLIIIDKENRMSYQMLGKEYEIWALRHVCLDDDIIKILYSDSNFRTKSAFFEIDGTLIQSCNVDLNKDWEEYPYLIAEFTKGKWFLFPFRSNLIQIIDSMSGRIEKVYNIPYCLNDKRKYFFGGSMIINNHVYAIDQVRGHLIKINVDDLEVQDIKLSLSKKGNEKLVEVMKNRTFNENAIIYEKKEWGDLNVLLDGLING